jgi:hypothetical protein
MNDEGWLSRIGSRKDAGLLLAKSSTDQLVNSVSGLLRLLLGVVLSAFAFRLFGEREFGEGGEFVGLLLPEVGEFLGFLGQLGGQVVLFGAVRLQVIEGPGVALGGDELVVADADGLVLLVQPPEAGACDRDIFGEGGRQTLARGGRGSARLSNRRAWSRRRVRGWSARRRRRGRGSCGVRLGRRCRRASGR